MKEQKEKVYAASIAYGTFEVGFAIVKKRTAKTLYIELPDDARTDLAAFGWRRQIPLNAKIAFGSMAEALKHAIERAEVQRKQMAFELREQDKLIAQARKLLKKAKK